jgi:hypothetical protein
MTWPRPTPCYVTPRSLIPIAPRPLCILFTAFTIATILRYSYVLLYDGVGSEKCAVR